VTSLEQPGVRHMAKILLVEDNEANRDMLSRRLQRKGHEVITVGDGEQAVAFARSGRPDIILMDLNLPILDGWAATRRIKAEIKTRGIPVIALTAHAMSGDRQKALATGCDDYDVKPVDFTRLMGKIESLLDGRGTADTVSGVDGKDASQPAVRPGPAATTGVLVSGKSEPLVLVVDDTRANRDLLERRLSKYGYRVEVAEDGETALRLVGEKSYDAILLDVMMPGINGLDVLRELRRTYAATDLPIIMATAKDASEDIVQAMQAGANDYVTKPLDFPVVLARLGTQLSLKASVEQIRHLEHGLEDRNAELQAANAQLRADLDAAAKVQTALLPVIDDRLPGYRFHWVFKPSTALGGDMFNVFRLDEHRAGFYILDVSGHGVAAALLSVTISRFLSPTPDSSSMLWRPSKGGVGYELESPTNVAARLSRRFPFDLVTGQYFTMIFGVLDLRTHMLTYVTAGHPNLIHLSAGQRARVLESSGYPVGVSDEAYEEYRVYLEPGDRLLAYSDGLTEAMGPGQELFGQRRVLEALDAARAGSIASILSDLSGRVDEWTGPGARQDDLSMLVLERV
jgi:phosphoserine phosphatase RsbU/P